MSGFLGDIAGDIGNGYQDILLQDSPLAGGDGPETDTLQLDFGGPETAPGMEADAAPLVGDVLPPETDAAPVTDVEALPQTIEADYSPVEEAEPVTAPEPVAEIDYTPQPDMGDELGPSF